MKLVRLVITLVLAGYAGAILRSPEPWAFVDNVNLAIHEAGHVVFAPFGETLALLGGTLLQFLVPLAFGAYFLRESDEHGASVALWWVGENCWCTAHYVRDAVAMELPLVGGGEHDWNTLLTRWDMLEAHARLADLLAATGVGAVALATLWGIMAVVRGRDATPVPVRPVPGAAARRY